MELYKDIHANTVLVCHDVFIQYQGGILLVKRGVEPAKGKYYCLGGRLLKGVGVEESLRMRVRKECGLELEDVEFLGVERTSYDTDPFDHGQGTDTVNLVYTAKGVGELKLDGHHSDPLIVHKFNLDNSEDWGLDDYIVKYLNQLL